MFNLPEFHALQQQRCKDLVAEADRERLALEAQKGQHASSKLADAAHDLLSRLSGIVSKS